MQFPRINAAINLTLLYYNKNQIVNGVGLLSGLFSPIKYTFNDVELPSWDEMVLNSHAQMEEEIKQIISLNYPHVQSMVFENLREWLTDIRIKSLNKELIIKVADENNQSEQVRLATMHPNGFAVTINKDFLPAYFEIVENAISNLKRIINKYLKLYDSDKLPKAFPMPSYIPEVGKPVINDSNVKLKWKVKVEELAFLFRILKDCGLIKSNYDKEIHTFIANNFETEGNAKISPKNVGRLWSTKDINVINFWTRKLIDISNQIKRK